MSRKKKIEQHENRDKFSFFFEIKILLKGMIYLYREATSNSSNPTENKSSMKKLRLRFNLIGGYFGKN